MALRITVDQLYTLLRNHGQFFSVEFERRTDREDGSAVAGDARKMLCRTGMHSYKKGVIADAARDAEDFRCGILTVWSMDAYMKQRRKGVEPSKAAFNAWRRVDLVTVKQCSVLGVADLPPDIIANAHQITNQYRLAHMPRAAI